MTPRPPKATIRVCSPLPSAISKQRPASAEESPASQALASVSKTSWFGTNFRVHSLVCAITSNSFEAPIFSHQDPLI